MKKILFSSLIISFFNVWSVFACTSMIISAGASSTGRPIMLKNRDTGELNNRMEYFKGPVYDFIGLVNSPCSGGEVWAGTNNAGFCIMNTASYNIKNDKISYDDMDKEGLIMFEALGVCATVDDFEMFLKNHVKPLGVEANFGVIDAKGGAAYFETNNYEWIKYDVNDSKVAPLGYRVMTNFSESGRYEQYEGWERYLTACDAMKSAPVDNKGKLAVDHQFIFKNFSRSYKHSLLGIDYDNISNIPDSGITVDQDFIPRKSTSASVVFEGVVPGSNPLNTVMWTLIGYPACSIAVPLMVSDSDRLPDFIKKSVDSNNCSICDVSLKVKSEQIFTFKISNGSKYFNILKAKQLSDKMETIENGINNGFSGIYSEYISGLLKKDDFYMKYNSLLDSSYNEYLALFTENN